MAAGAPRPSIVAGPPLADEPGIGALTLGGWLAELARRYGPSEALIWHEAGLGGGERTVWTYDDLWDRAQAVARALVAGGLAKGERVGVLMTNRPEFLSAVWGTALAGGVAAPISTFSTEAELGQLLALSCVSVLLAERRVLKKDFAATLVSLVPEIGTSAPGAIVSSAYPFLSRVAAVGGGEGAIEDWDAFLASGDGVDPALVAARAATVTPADPAGLFFSSGSTGKPKGILSANRGIALQLWRWKRFYKGGEDMRTWSANGFFWSGNFGQAIGGTLSSGGCLILQPVFEAEGALALMEAERATMAVAWPHQWAQLAAAPRWRTVDLSAMRYVNPGNVFGQHPTIDTDWDEPWYAYGNTETFTISAIYPSQEAPPDPEGTHGVPLPGNVFKIADPLTGAVVPIGERGEIGVKGPTLMLGYLGTPLDETLDADGFLMTGDGGFFDEGGRLHWEGRLNDIIKTGGANVSPVEIDGVLKAHPGVKVTQTVGVPHETLGELVVACIVPHDGAAIDEAAVQAHARASLASYKVPRRVLFFAEDELATTGSAKVKTADLRALAAARLAAA